MNPMLIATLIVAVTNVILVGLYVFSIIQNNKVIGDLLNRLSAKNYSEYAHVELEKGKELTRRVNVGKEKKANFVKV